MAKKKASKIGKEARNVGVDVKRAVLHEAGYKCASPRCRYPITLDIHHLHYVSEGGSGDSANLLPLCPTCHAEHHKGIIPTESLRAWKMLLVALNEAFDRRSVELLLMLASLKQLEHVTPDGLPDYASLFTSGFVNVSYMVKCNIMGVSGPPYTLYRVTLTERGKLFVEGWQKGDQKAAIAPTQETL